MMYNRYSSKLSLNKAYMLIRIIILCCLTSPALSGLIEPAAAQDSCAPRYTVSINNTPVQKVLAAWSTATGIAVELDATVNYRATLNGEFSAEAIIDALGKGLNTIKTRVRRQGCTHSVLKEVAIIKKGSTTHTQMLRFLPRPSRKNLVIDDMQDYVLKYAYGGSRKSRMTEEQRELFVQTKNRLKREGKLNEH